MTVKLSLTIFIFQLVNKLVFVNVRACARFELYPHPPHPPVFTKLSALTGDFICSLLEPPNMLTVDFYALPRQAGGIQTEYVHKEWSR